MPDTIKSFQHREWLKPLSKYFKNFFSISSFTNLNAPIQIYTSKTIHELPCKEHEEIYFFKSLIEKDLCYFIENIKAELNLLKIDHHLIPILITTNSHQNSYVCSPYNHYISLASLPFSSIKNKWIKNYAFLGLQLFGSLIRAGDINQVVYINHSLLATDLQLNILSKYQIERLVEFIENKFPRHSIIFRSINSATCSKLQKNLKSLGFNFIASRKIHLTHPSPELFKTRIIKSDLKLWKENPFTLVDLKNFTEQEEQRVLELYQMLSIDHHSHLNPKINLSFLQLLKRRPNFRFKVLMKDGVIEGAVGYHTNHENVFLCPFFGYNLNHPMKTQIYRILSTFLLLEAQKNGALFHQSAGASFYKTVRRAKSLIEYQGCYTKHLSFKQKITWLLLRSIMNSIGVSFMKKY